MGDQEQQRHGRQEEGWQQSEASAPPKDEDTAEDIERSDPSRQGTDTPVGDDQGLGRAGHTG
jgi:hypothetical protein